MKISDINNIKNKDYIVLLPECDYDIKDSVEYSFENVIYFDYVPTKEDAKMLIDFINEKANQLILFDYMDFYRLVLPYIRKSKKIKWIYKNNLAALTDGCVRATFTNIMEFYDRNIINKIGCLDRSTYEVLKKAKYNVEYVLLDVKTNKHKNKATNSIGIIGNDYNPNHNIYNELSAVKMLDGFSVKIIKHMPATNHFLNFFGINEIKTSNLVEVIKNNYVNLYCNFTFLNVELVLKSMDMGIPCILGNSNIFDRYPKLKKYLSLESDDDINEIAIKINYIKEKRNEILSEYKKFRIKYSLESKKSLEKLLK